MYYQNKQKNFLKVPFTDCFLAADLVDFFMLCDDFWTLKRLSTVPALPKMHTITTIKTAVTIKTTNLQILVKQRVK